MSCPVFPSAYFCSFGSAPPVFVVWSSVNFWVIIFRMFSFDKFIIFLNFLQHGFFGFAFSFDYFSYSSHFFGVITISKQDGHICFLGDVIETSFPFFDPGSCSFGCIEQIHSWAVIEQVHCMIHQVLSLATVHTYGTEASKNKSVPSLCVAVFDEKSEGQFQVPKSKNRIEKIAV